MTAWGGCFFGPVAVQWYKLLGRISFPDHPNRELLARVAADQIIFTPVNLLCFFTGMTLLEGGNPKDKLEKSYLTTLRNNWMLWPSGFNFCLTVFGILTDDPGVSAVQLVNFKVVPLEHRLLVVNIVSLGMPHSLWP